MDAGRHPRIELLSFSEVEEVSGYIGNFTARIRKKARYVDDTLCTGCGICEHECPVSGKRAIRVSAENESRNRRHSLVPKHQSG